MCEEVNLIRGERSPLLRIHRLPKHHHPSRNLYPHQPHHLPRIHPPRHPRPRSHWALLRSHAPHRKHQLRHPRPPRRYHFPRHPRCPPDCLVRHRRPRSLSPSNPHRPRHLRHHHACCRSRLGRPHQTQVRTPHRSTHQCHGIMAVRHLRAWHPQLVFFIGHAEGHVALVPWIPRCRCLSVPLLLQGGACKCRDQQICEWQNIS